MLVGAAPVRQRVEEHLDRGLAIRPLELLPRPDGCRRWSRRPGGSPSPLPAPPFRASRRSCAGRSCARAARPGPSCAGPRARSAPRCLAPICEPTARPPARPTAAAPAARPGFLRLGVTTSVDARRSRPGRGCHGAPLSLSPGSSRCAPPGRRLAPCPWRRSSSSCRAACWPCRRSWPRTGRPHPTCAGP